MHIDPRSVASTRLLVELVEADVEIAFNLVDMAERESGAGQFAVASEVLENAERVLHDLNDRLTRLPEIQTENFNPLRTEIRRAIDLARSHLR